MTCAHHWSVLSLTGVMLNAARSSQRSVSPAGSCLVSPRRCPSFPTASSHFISSQHLWQEESFFILSVIFSVSVQPPAASEPHQTPPAELLNAMPLNNHFTRFFLRLSILPASRRPLAELLNSRTLADVILLRRLFLLLHFHPCCCFGFIWHLHLDLCSSLTTLI